MGDGTSPLDAKLSNPLMGGASFPLSHRLTRLAWGIVWTAFGSWTPAPLFAWRRMLLQLFGARLAATARIYPKVNVWFPANLEMAEWACLGRGVTCYSMAPIRLGRHALVSQGAHLCAGTHDVDDPDFQLRVAPITLEANAWVAAEAFVGPGVTLHRGSVLGARGVLFKDLPELVVAVGNPAKALRRREVDFDR
jgi:putative colanic acid biosynthesis acetyltransferase WcaF